MVFIPLSQSRFALLTHITSTILLHLDFLSMPLMLLYIWVNGNINMKHTLYDKSHMFGFIILIHSSKVGAHLNSSKLDGANQCCCYSWTLTVLQMLSGSIHRTSIQHTICNNAHGTNVWQYNTWAVVPIGYKWHIVVHSIQ